MASSSGTGHDAAQATRQYRMLRLGKGDYLLPSNDATILWRIAQYDEDDGTKPWGLWRWDGGMPTVDQVAAALDEGMWTDRWDYWDGGYKTRASVVEYLNKCREGNDA